MLVPGRRQRRKLFESQELSNLTSLGGMGYVVNSKMPSNVKSNFICLNQLELVVLSILGHQSEGEVGLDPNITVSTRKAKCRATKTQKQEIHASMRFSAKYN